MENENKSVLPFKLHEGYKAGESEVIKFIDINKLKESKTNPRKVYEEKALNDLADSIKIKGILQNLVVRPLKETLADYEIVAGSRRFRAAKIADLKAVPCVIRTYTDAEVLEIQVIENNQREDVHPLEEGEGYAALLKVEGYTVEAIASKIGRSDKYVRERLQLAHLSPKAKELYQKDILKYTHCRILARLTIEQQENAIKDIVRDDYLTSGKHSLAVKSLEYWVESNIEKKLGSASFPLDDKTLNKEMGACIGCIKNTASDGQLFPEYASKAAKGVCLKPECFNIKVRAHAERLVKEKANDENLKDVLMVSETSWKNNVKKVGKNEKLVIGYENWERVKKGDKGARAAVIVGTRNIEEKGKTIYVKLRNKKDALPSKNEKRNNSYNSEPVETPEQKAEKERKDKHKRTSGFELMKIITDKIFLSFLKKNDKNLLKIAYVNAMLDFQWQMKGKLAGMTYAESNDASIAKIDNLLKAKIDKMNFNEIEALFVASSLINDVETENDVKNVCKTTGVNLKKCIEESIKIADERYPDPSKQLIVTFAGMKYNIKENDYLSELQAISQLLRKYIEKEKPQEMKSMNLINPGAGQPNVFFRKDAKTGLYKFSEWIDKDGTAMGFDRMTKDKFIKCIKGFKAVTKSEVKKK